MEEVAGLWREDMHRDRKPGGRSGNVGRDGKEWSSFLESCVVSCPFHRVRFVLMTGGGGDSEGVVFDVFWDKERAMSLIEPVPVVEFFCFLPLHRQEASQILQKCPISVRGGGQMVEKGRLHQQERKGC